jgi:hypothetical protein
MVNEQGYLIDAKKNIIDRYGRKKLDKRQIEINGDLKRLYNYDARRFDVNDVIGTFDRNQKGDIILLRDKNGFFVDQEGHRVNERGYLIDEDGNIIDKEGHLIFEKRHLSSEGEFPKIFPFSRFNIEDIRGKFDRKADGAPKLKRNRKNQHVDNNGRLVNHKGYLRDENLNVIDIHSNVFIHKKLLYDEGEVPKIFRTGLLRSNSLESLSRLMSEIEHASVNIKDIDDDDIDEDEDMIENELNKLRGDSGNTSIDSLMEDTPSNYNIANQRFESEGGTSSDERPYMTGDGRISTRKRAQ